jgi:hypothetical protein
MVAVMTCLILTTGARPLSDAVTPIGVLLPFRHCFDNLQRLIHGHPPTDAEIDDYVAPWSEQRHGASGSHWLDYVSSTYLSRFDLQGLGLAELASSNFRRRDEIYKKSRPRLTELGEAVLHGLEDFSRHNPIHRWWGGTELTNANLWRWDPVAQTLVAP